MSTIDIKDHTQDVINEKNRAINMALEMIGLQAEKYAKLATPVDTGRLRNSMTHEVKPSEQAVYIGTNVEYGKYVEFGTGQYAEGGKGRKTPWWYMDEKGKWHYTHGTKPHHMLKKAVMDHTEEYKRMVADCLKG